MCVFTVTVAVASYIVSVRSEYSEYIVFFSLVWWYSATYKAEPAVEMPAFISVFYMANNGVGKAFKLKYKSREFTLFSS